MNMIVNIALRELRVLFSSPLAWSILAVLQVILAYLFLSQVDAFLILQSQLATLENAPGLSDLIVSPLYSSAAIIMLLITPLLTMRLISEERRNKTLSLLLSAPVSNVEIILGKYLGVFGFLLLMVLMLTLMTLSLLAGGEIDIGNLFSNVLALTLLLSCFAAIGLYMSSIASHPTVAAVSTFGVLLLLWILDWTTGSSTQSGETLEYVSILSHFQQLQTGLINSKDVIYYLLFSATFLILSVRQLDNDRLQK